MSATILDPSQINRNIGLTMHHRTFEYHRLPSLFPKENRPVIYEPSANMTFKTMTEELPKLATAVDRILKAHPDEKVLCHSVSYRIRDYLMDHLAQKPRLMSHDAKDRVECLERFKKDSGPRVLISPSMDRGVDLPEEECRVVIIAKLPYPNLGDPQIKKRVYSSKDGDRWYAHKTASSIIQMAGRGVRSAEDTATTYILDSQFERVYDHNIDLFPEWFSEALID
jgi:Rad3-related DNA helicase